MQAGVELFDGHTVRSITCKDRLGSYHYIKKGRGADVPKTASVVAQPRYTETELHFNDRDSRFYIFKRFSKGFKLIEALNLKVVVNALYKC